MSYIKIIENYLPEQKLYFSSCKIFFEETDEDLPFKEFESFNDFMNNRLRLESVAVEKEKSFEEMAIHLLDQNLDNGNIVPEKIDFIIVAVDFDDQMKNFGHYIQHEFGMDNANVIRLTGNFCCNIDMAIILADKILSSEVEKEMNILILTGSKLNDSLERRIVGTYGVMGDSVGLMIISNLSENAMFKVEKSKIVTKGVLNEVDLKKDNAILHFQSYMECLNGLFINTEKGDINKIILHNSNQALLEQVLLTSGFKLDLIDKTNANKYGHLGTTDLLLNLKTYSDNENRKGFLFSLNLGIVGTYVSILFNKL